jgi:hypothetical protein
MKIKGPIFTELCLNGIKEARKVLDHHRGWKQFLANFASALASFCSLGIANLVTGRSIFGLFPTKTDSAQKIDEFESGLNAPSLCTYSA